MKILLLLSLLIAQKAHSTYNSANADLTHPLTKEEISKLSLFLSVGTSMGKDNSGAPCFVKYSNENQQVSLSVSSDPNTSGTNPIQLIEGTTVQGGISVDGKTIQYVQFGNDNFNRESSFNIRKNDDDSILVFTNLYLADGKIKGFCILKP